jgi:preprotein translocase subunit SecE
VAKAETRATKENFIIRYLKETRAELRKVHWPSQQEARMLTIVVMSVTIGMAVLLGVLDYVFDRLLNGIIDVDPLAIGVSVVFIVGMFVVGRVVTREE